MPRRKNFFYKRKSIWSILTEKRLTLNLFASIYFVIGLSILTTLLMFYIQPVPITMIFSLFVQSRFLTFFLNWLPILLSSLVLFFIFNSVFFSTGVILLIVSVLSIINRFMLLIRNDPFFPWDFNLGQEFFGVTANFPIYQFILFIIGVVFAILIIIISYFVVRTYRVSFVLRSIGSIFCIALMIILNNTTYSSLYLANRLPVHGNSFNQANVFNSRGFLYSFILAHNTQRISLPNDFDQPSVRAMYYDFEPSTNSKLATPHIIIIMSEAFTDITMNDKRFDFTGFVDPHYNWRNLINRPNVINGNIVVPNLGGGTADTEFDVLTALNTRALRGTSFSYMLVRNYFEAMPNLLATLGYRSIALHPGFPWFYNRQNVFHWFGFDYFYNLDYFDYSHFKGSYISEVATMDKLINTFNDHLENYPNIPFFNFNITIQNHGPYLDLYNLPDNYRNFYTSINFSDREINQLTNFFYGLADIDKQIGRLIKYFENHLEPIVILYYSDHLPSLGDYIYNILLPYIEPDDSFKNITRLYTVPFAIWQNNAAEQITPISQNRYFSPMPYGMTITSNFLGAYFFQLLGFNKLSPFWDFVNELRSQFPIILEDRSFAIDGTLSLDMPMNSKRNIILYRDWQFYRIFN